LGLSWANQRPDFGAGPGDRVRLVFIHAVRRSILVFRTGAGVADTGSMFASLMSSFSTFLCSYSLGIRIFVIDLLSHSGWEALYKGAAKSRLTIPA
jgi:hypothetical protein